MEEEKETKKETLFSLSKKVKDLEERVSLLERNPIGNNPKPIEQPETPKVEQKYPVPTEYREIIDSVLNSHFGITVEPLPDRPAFVLNIIVPEKYSNMSEDEKRMYKVDIRSKVISYAEGANGVRQYAELVANNLGPEIRANIIADRALLQ